MLWLRRQNAGRLFLHRVEFCLEGGKRFEKAQVISVVDSDDRFGRVRLEGMLCSFSVRGLGGALRLLPDRRRRRLRLELPVPESSSGTTAVKIARCARMLELMEEG